MLRPAAGSAVRIVVKLPPERRWQTRWGILSLWPAGLRGWEILVLRPAAVSARRLAVQHSLGRRLHQCQVTTPLLPPLHWGGLRGRGSRVVPPAAVPGWRLAA